MTDPTTARASAAEPGLHRERIEHVIVLLMENRSFDHLLGYLQHDDETYPSLARQKVSCPVDPQRPDGKRVDTSDDATSVLGTDPDHSHEAVMLQMFGRRNPSLPAKAGMDGFIRSYQVMIEQGTLRRSSVVERIIGAVMTTISTLWNWIRRRPRPVRPRPKDIMRCFRESRAPVLSTLAKEYAVLVNWHASVPGETWPNRNFAHAATSDGTVNIEPRFYRNRTIFEQLDQAAADSDAATSDRTQGWRIYHDGVAQVWAFPALWREGTERFSDGEQLINDILGDRLPRYAFVEPNHGYGKGEGNSQHPGNNTTSGDSFVAGEVLMGRIYNALVNRPEVFAKTLFLITYDEHGGFFDHVPPRDVLPPDGEVASHGFPFSITGARVPAVAISPLIPRGHVEHGFFDHASIPATVRHQFAPRLKPLTARDGAAADVIGTIPLLPTPRTDVRTIDLPSIPQAARRAPAVSRRAPAPRLSEFEASLLELAGAVKTAIETPHLAEAVDGMPAFQPDPALSAAARSRVLVPGSEASRAVDEVVGHFTAPTPP